MDIKLHRLLDKARRESGSVAVLAICSLCLVAAIGVYCIGFLMMMGGARELQAADDAAALYVAKAALAAPQQGASAFSNPDVASNFALLGAAPGQQLNLNVYNRCAAQTMIVACNARDENTAIAAGNARKCWQALNDVGQYIRQHTEDPTWLASKFSQSANANSVSMLAAGQSSAFSSGQIGFARVGSASNVLVDPVLLSTFVTPPTLPSVTLNTTGNTYIAGYKPVVVNLPANGDQLEISTVPLGPASPPHLISNGEFSTALSDSFIAGTGSPSYPNDTIPGNAFQLIATGQAKNSLISSTSSSFVGSLNKPSSMQHPFAYLEFSNQGFSFPGVGTPYQYLQFADTNSPGLLNSVLAYILARAQQIDPTMTLAQVQAALNSVMLPPGSTCYLYAGTPPVGGMALPEANPFKHVFDLFQPAYAVPVGRPNNPKTPNNYGPLGIGLSPAQPPGYTGVDADGRPVTFAGAGVTWLPATGYNMLLGRVNFTP